MNYAFRGSLPSYLPLATSSTVAPGRVGHHAEGSPGARVFPLEAVTVSR